jgi:hypothetical protein
MTTNAVTALQKDIPGARVEEAEGRATTVYGATLSTGTSAALSAESFKRKHASAFSADPADLVEMPGRATAATTDDRSIGLMWDNATQKYRFWLKTYQQARDGIAVHGATLRTLLRNIDGFPVIWAHSTAKPLGTWRPSATTRSLAAPDLGKVALAVRAAWGDLGRPGLAPTQFAVASEIKPVIFAGAEGKVSSPVMASEFVVKAVDANGSWKLVTDSQTGEVLNIENVEVFENVLGSVKANVTLGDKGMECGAATAKALPYAQVTATGLGDFFADATGNFTVVNPDTTAVGLSSPVRGTYFNVSNYTGSNDVVTASVVPPGPIDLVHTGTVTTQAVLAQSNAYAQANEIRDFLLSFLPNYPAIANQTNFPIYANRGDNYCPGNAWYDSSLLSLNFCSASSTYGNTAFASVVHHEYGHHIVQMGGSGQGAYGEGMSDAIALLFSDDSGLGFGFYLNQCTTPLRDANNTCQYSATSCSSCGSEAHACGNLLSGVVWSIRNALLATDPASYRQILSNIVLSSVPMHTGTTINANIAIAMLTLDDNDGNLDNGTPHYQQICSGFGAHGISCPALKTGLSIAPVGDFTSEGPVGGPFNPSHVSYTLTNLGPEPTLAYQVASTATAPWLSISNATGQLAVGQTAQVVIAIDPSQANSLPFGRYSTQVNFVNATTGTGNGSRLVHLKVGSVSPIYNADFASGLGGFVVDSPTASNLWHVSTSCVASLSGHTTPGVLYFGKDDTCTFATGSAVSGTATSPEVVVKDPREVQLQFKYYLATEGSSSYDSARAMVSVNGGAYTVVASNNAGGTALTDGQTTWQTAQVDVTNLVAGLTSPTLKVRFSFNSIDSIGNSYKGFAVDDVQVLALPGTCTTDTECSDGLLCNGTETCSNGSCIPGTAVQCNDGIACTVDSCSETVGGCVATPNNAACNDGLACNGTEVCNALSGCGAGTALNCDDASVCTTDSCVEPLGCQHVAVSCSDSNACTTDSCNDTSGCQHAQLSCNDSNACTVESCDAAIGCLSAALDCSDNDACTADSCDTASGCAHTAMNCDDANACTTDSCNTNTGCAHASVNCDDGNDCTADSCNATSGCTHAPVTGGCADDGNACTDDVCASGACTHVDNGTCTLPTTFLESNGQVVMEAEHFVTNTPRSSHTWDLTANTSASNGQVMVANPNSNVTINTGYTTTSPQLDFPVQFTTPGTYYVWVRAIGPSGNDDSCHAGLDGNAMASADRMGSFSTTLSWSRATLDGPVASINVASAGVHVFNLWMREDGVRIDRILLTTNSGYTPSGAGPAESPRGNIGACTSAAQCDDGNACTTDTCSAGVCGHSAAPNGTTCADDGNSCTSDTCNAGSCTHLAVTNGTACADDGNSCTTDACSAGVCTHTSNGSCTSTPCSNYCSNPITFSGNFQSGNLGTAATCHQTTGTINGGNCGNFVTPRQLFVNGQAMTCNGGNWASLPAKVNNGYCVYTTAGNNAWAYFTTW